MNIKNKLELEKELAEWKGLFIRTKKMIDELLPTSEKEKQTALLKTYWENIKKLLEKVYLNEPTI